MRNYRILLYVAGMVILGACAYIIYDKFTDPSVFWLDLVVVLFLYTINIWGMKSLFISSDRFGKAVGAYGVILGTQFIYSLFAITGILLGYFMEIELGWQFIYQAFFVLFLCLGGYMALFAAKRQQRVEEVEQQNRKPLLNLKEKTDILRYKASSSAQLSTAHKQRINLLVERIGMFSSNTSAIAVLIEGELSDDLDGLTQLISTTAINVTFVEQALIVVELKVAERMKLVIT